MSYTDLFINQERCDYLLNIQLSIFIIAFTMTSLCIWCKPNKEIEKIKAENQNLKQLILQSFSKVFNDALKNGYDSEYD